MDDKKKLDAYLPDKVSKAEKVVIGLSGSLDSYVMAYLLKIQKYDLVGVTVIPGAEQVSATPDKIFSCHINSKKLETIKEFCNKMGIPHYALKADSEFRYQVIDPWLASRICASLRDQCWNCHTLRMSLLFHKAKELGIKSVATGHFAKIFKNEAHGTSFIHSSNDEEHDQSALLSRLPQEILNSLLLPLSDLQNKEVIKLGENFGLTESQKEVRIHECLPWVEETKTFFKSQVPERFFQEGEIIRADNSENFGSHAGVIEYSYGKALHINDKKDELFISKYTYGDKKIHLENKSFFKRSNFSLVRCEISAETQWSVPFKGVIQIGHEQVDCFVHPKTHHSAWVEIETPQEVFEGMILPLYKKKGKNSKVFLTGKVRFLNSKINETENDNEDEVPNAKVNNNLDF